MRSFQEFPFPLSLTGKLGAESMLSKVRKLIQFCWRAHFTWTLGHETYRILFLKKLSEIFKEDEWLPINGRACPRRKVKRYETLFLHFIGVNLYLKGSFAIFAMFCSVASPFGSSGRPHISFIGCNARLQLFQMRGGGGCRTQRNILIQTPEYFGLLGQKWWQQ